MTGPEQFRPPVYACVAGTVLHGHAADTLEPGVLLFTFLPPGAADDLAGGSPRVDVHADGAGTSTATVRVLAGETALTWQLPLASLVAALPGQSGEDGRMVLLALIDAEPEAGFWAEPVDCGRLVAELQLPVADLAEALRGRLTPWLDEDLRLLLEDDDYHRAAERSPAQTLADAVTAQYRGDLEAEQAVTRLLRALTLAPPEHSLELGALLCTALIAAVDGTADDIVARLIAETGPFETEVLRLLEELPARVASTPEGERVEAAMQLLLAGDREDSIRGAVSVLARLARARYGADLPDDELLRRLEVVDDAGLARLARLWVALAVAAAGVTTDDDAAAAQVLAGVRAQGPPARRWLRVTASALGSLAEEVTGRATDRIAQPLAATYELIEGEPTADGIAGAVQLARFIRARGRIAPAAWLALPTPAAVSAVLGSTLDGLDPEITIDLLADLLADDVTGVDLLDGFVCATAQVLAELEPEQDEARRETQVAEALSAVPGGPRGGRWLLAACLREAHDHDPAAPDLAPYLPRDLNIDPDRAADKAGRLGMLRSGLVCLDALAATFGGDAELSREDVLTGVLPTALLDHDLLRGS